MGIWDFSISITVLCFPLPARPYSHPADRLAEEMYLLTSINFAVLQALTPKGTPVNETSFIPSIDAKEYLFLFSEEYYHRLISLEYF